MCYNGSIVTRIERGSRTYLKNQYFSTIFTKGNNFSDYVFVSQDEDVFQNGIKTLIKDFALWGSKSFFLELKILIQGLVVQN